MDLLNALEHAIDDHYGFEKMLSDGAGGFHERLFWKLWNSQTYIDNEGLELRWTPKIGPEAKL
jgi:hypothetical protein